MKESDTICVVSSCSKVGWDEYGARFVSSFKNYWPKNIVLHLVSEDALPLLSEDNILVHNLHASAEWKKFDQNFGVYRWVHGDGSCPRPVGVARPRPGEVGYSFRYDAYKFSKKVFAIDFVASRYKMGRLCWLDADTVTHAPIPETLPVNLLPINYCLSCLARVGYHSECGFVGYNLQHEQTFKFIKAFVDLYVSGGVFELAEWHDSWVFDWLRNKMMVPTHNIPHKSKGHPFINSELGRYIDHLKGARKQRGKSNPAELVHVPNTAYWGAR